MLYLIRCMHTPRALTIVVLLGGVPATVGIPTTTAAAATTTTGVPSAPATAPSVALGHVTKFVRNSEKTNRYVARYCIA